MNTNVLQRCYITLFSAERSIDGNGELSIVLSCLLALATGVSQIVGILASAFVCAIMLYNIRKDTFYLFFPLIMFFETQLILPFGLGSIMRVFYILIIAKTLIEIGDLRVRLGLVCLSIPLLVLEAFKISDGIYNLAIAINTVVIIVLNSKTINNQRLLGKILLAIGYIALFTGFFGLLNGHYLDGVAQIGTEYYPYKRLYGTIADPNYSCMVFSLGIFAVLSSDAGVSLLKKILLVGGLYACLFMTASTQGVTGNLIMLIGYYAVLKKGYRHGLLGRGLAILLIVTIGLVLWVSNIEIVKGYKYRIQSIISQSENLSLDEEDRIEFCSDIDSGRGALNRLYLDKFSELPVQNKAFGGELVLSNPEKKERYVAEFLNVSHNTYIDMLFEVGIVGTGIIVIGFLVSGLCYFLNYRKTGNSNMLGVLMLKGVILFSGLGLSIFPFRYFLYVFLL